LVPGGAAILNRDNPYFERLRRHAWQRKAKVVSFGETQGADARSLSVELGPESSEVKADILGETVSYRIGAPGIHFVQNSLAVLAAAKLADADLKAAARALAGWHAQTGRGERIVIGGKGGRVEPPVAHLRGERVALPGGALVLNDCYNASPLSMRAALAELSAEPAEGRRVAVLGDMLELGPEAPRYHAEIGAYAREHADVIVTVGPLAAQMGGDHEAATAAQAVGIVRDLIRPGDTVLVKGSRGVGLEAVAEAL
jgi:UDP-N-acetylmuramoyl-tripeptide--D-alanyl-D-alanine ligase